MEFKMSKLIRILRRVHPIIWLALLLVLLFSPTLFFEKIQRSVFDIVFIYYPQTLGFWNDGHIWSKYILSGYPVSLTTIFGGTWILFLPLVKILSPMQALFTVVLGALFLTALFIYLLCRELQLSKVASMIAAVIYIFSEHLFTEAYRSPTVASSLIVFPALLYVFLKIKKKFSWFYVLFGGIISAFGLAMGHPQWTLMAFIGAAFLCCYWLFFDRWLNRRQIIQFILSGILIVIIGLALSWWQINPFISLEKDTFRAAGESIFNPSAGLGPIELVSFVFPFFDDILVGNKSVYVGFLPFILALFAVFYGAYKQKHMKPFYWFLIFGFLISIKYSPIAWVIQEIPILQIAKNWTRFLDIVLVILAYFAALGFEMIWERRNEISSFGFFKYIKWLLAIFISSVVLINIAGLLKKPIIFYAVRYFDSHIYNETKLLPIDYYHNLIGVMVNSNFWMVSFKNFNFLITFIVIVSCMAAILYLKKLSRISFAAIIIASSFVMAFNLSGDIISLKVIAKNYAAAQFIKNKNGIFRIYSLTPQTVEYRLLSAVHGTELNFSDRVEFFRGMIAANSNIIDGLDSIDGFDSFMRKRTNDVLSKLLSERTFDSENVLGSNSTIEDKYKLVTDHLNLLSMMNVRFLISAYLLEDPRLRKVFETTATKFNIPIYVYENPFTLPRFYFANSPFFISGNDKNIFKILISPGFDFKEKTIIECTNCETGEAGAFDTFKVVSYKSGRAFFKTQTEHNRWLVFSEDKSYGWKAFLDGKEIPIYTANYLYQAAFIPSGSHDLEFKFDW